MCQAVGPQITFTLHVSLFPVCVFAHRYMQNVCNHEHRSVGMCRPEGTTRHISQLFLKLFFTSVEEGCMGVKNREL